MEFFSRAIWAVCVNHRMHQTSCQPRRAPRCFLSDPELQQLLSSDAQRIANACEHRAMHGMQCHVEKHKPVQLSLYGFYCKHANYRHCHLHTNEVPQDCKTPTLTNHSYTALACGFRYNCTYILCYCVVPTENLTLLNV